MPIVSRSQNRFFRWADEHPEESGVKPSVSHEFLSTVHGKSLKGLPEHVEHKAEGGAVKPYTPVVFKW